MDFRSTSRRGQVFALAVIAIVLLVHLSGVGSMVAGTGVCHIANGQPGCIVSDALQETLAASVAILFIAVLVALRVARFDDHATAIASLALARTRIQPLALASPMQRVLWKRTTQRTDGDALGRYRMGNLLRHLSVNN